MIVCICVCGDVQACAEAVAVYLVFVNVVVIADVGIYLVSIVLFCFVWFARSYTIAFG